jgi:proteic killer suppression protein
MIRSFRHKGLRLLFENDDRSKVQAAQADRISRILGFLDRASEPEDMALPGWRLHPLRGDLSRGDLPGFWAVSVSANWRVIWRFDGPDVADVDLIDYH